MRLILAISVLALIGLAVWASGAMDVAGRWAAGQQREFQNAMAAAVQAVRTGTPGAWATLLGACAAYGFVHAVGPGHGKYLIGGAGLASRAGTGRMVALALASSLAQAGTAILLVYGGFLLFEMSASWAVGTAEKVLAPLSYAAILAIGGVLVWRALCTLAAAGQRADHAHHHGDAHHHHEIACGCGHAHAPTPAQAAAVRGWRDAAALIAGIAIRPCTGAIFVLVIAWRMDLHLAGVASVVTMGLGTGAFVSLVAVSAVAARGATILAAGAPRQAALALPLLQLLAGSTIALVSASMIWWSLAA